MENNSQKSIVSAIIIVGVLIAGAILLKGSSIPKNPQANEKGVPVINGIPVTTATLAPVGKEDKTLGNPQAKVTLIMYEDFQCPFCGAVTGLELNSPSMKPVMDYLKKNDPTWTPFMPEIINNYVNTGKVLFVYRDFTFLGPESVKASEAARCAGDQGKFWEYYNYLYGHQNGENKGGFSDTNLKFFAKTLGLDTSEFNKCLDSGKYTEAVTDSKTEGTTAGVTGTPKGFILRDNKIAGTIDGAESWSTVKPKIDSALQ
ncbi:MAG: thioredoxin domain-containing protein [Candidatus Pacebacteria bacterium]|nr:thioredoxin domain-containing protein [Candidatus Paceibacterota bacterium]